MQGWKKKEEEKIIVCFYPRPSNSQHTFSSLALSDITDTKLAIFPRTFKGIMLASTTLRLLVPRMMKIEQGTVGVVIQDRLHREQKPPSRPTGTGFV